MTIEAENIEKDITEIDLLKSILRELKLLNLVLDEGIETGFKIEDIDNDSI